MRDFVHVCVYSYVCASLYVSFFVRVYSFNFWQNYSKDLFDYSMDRNLQLKSISLSLNVIFVTHNISINAFNGVICQLF